MASALNGQFARREGTRPPPTVERSVDIQEETMSGTRPIRVHTVVVGGGQAGLLMGYQLRQLGDDVVILDALTRVGDSWRQRYDSLRLFSTPRYASLPGWRIPVSDCPTRDQMAD